MQLSILASMEWDSFTSNTTQLIVRTNLVHLWRRVRINMYIPTGVYAFIFISRPTITSSPHPPLSLSLYPLSFPLNPYILIFFDPHLYPSLSPFLPASSSFSFPLSSLFPLSILPYYLHLLLPPSLVNLSVS